MNDIIFAGIAQDEYDPDEAVIEFKRTEEFVKTAKEVSDFITALPLNREQNDQLIDLLVKHVKCAEEGAFKEGFGLGLKCAKYEAEHPDET